MASPSYNAAQLLVARNVGVLGSPGSWPIFIGRTLDAPDALIAIYDTPGQNPNPRWLLEYPTIMVWVRGARDDYQTAWAKGKEVKDCLLGINPFTFGTGDRWDGVTMLGDLNFLRYDDNSRPLFSLNFRIILEPATNALTSREPL